MSERKVLTKYYPPDFDPSKIERVRRPASQATKLETVRLMAPFTMQCTTCGEFIYTGRKFNARKQITGEEYYSTKIIRFYIKCTRCSAEITFRTDPQTKDFLCERGAKRNFEPWRDRPQERETPEQVLDRLQREEEDEQRDAMGELEAKILDTKREMAIADGLDALQTRNAVHQRVEKGEVPVELVVARLPASVADQAQRKQQEMEDEDAARRAFGRTTEQQKVEAEDSRDETDEADRDDLAAARSAPTKGADDTLLMPPPPPPSLAPLADFPAFARSKKRKRDLTAALGIKKRIALV